MLQSTPRYTQELGLPINMSFMFQRG